MPTPPAPAPESDEILPDWPLFGWADDVRPALKRARTAGTPAAMVTLHTSLGGGPRPVGTQMLFAGTQAAGFLSGGCLEADVARHAHQTLDDGQPRHLVYGEGGPPDIRLLCGARIALLIERIVPDDAAAGELLSLTERRRPALWRSDGRLRWAEPAEPQTIACAVRDEPFELTKSYAPIPRLVIVGADPTALAIAQLGLQAGFETHLVRPKGPAEPPPLPGLAYHRRAPAEAMAEIGLDPWTSVAVATHDWEIDQAALVAALPSPAPYVGVLGARRRLPERLARLAEAGVTLEQRARLRGPIGLDLGGKAPWEVAVAVVAEMVAARR